MGTLLVGAAGLIVGALLPWATVDAVLFSATANGIDGDGVITLIVGGIVAIFVALLRGRRGVAAACLLLGLLAGVVALVDLVNVSSRVGDVQSTANLALKASVGVGLWLTALAAVAVVVGSVGAFVQSRQQR